MAPRLLNSNPKPVVPIEVLSQIMTSFPITEFLITTLFLIIQLPPILTPLHITEFTPIVVDSWILENLEIYEPLIKSNWSGKFLLSS